MSIQVLEILKSHRNEGKSMVALEADNADKNRSKDILPSEQELCNIKPIFHWNLPLRRLIFA